MKPDLTNILTVSKEDAGSRPQVVIRHRTFPEIEIESGSMVAGLEALLSTLKQFGDWTKDKDELQRSALGQAIVEVETALTLLAPSGRTRRICKDCNITRHNDLVYIFEKTQDRGTEDASGQDDPRPEYQRDPTACVQIFANGRRCVNRRRVVDDGADASDRIERRQLERRILDRRALNRIVQIADIPQSTDPQNAVALEEANLPLPEV